MCIEVMTWLGGKWSKRNMEHVAALSAHVIPPHELIPREHRARFPI